MPLTVQLAIGVLAFMVIAGTIVWRTASAFDRAFPGPGSRGPTTRSSEGDAGRRSASG